MKKDPAHAFVLLRFGLAFVFIWFAAQQFGNPERWVSFLPDFLQSSASATKFILANASFEILASLLLILGAWTRLVGFLLALHLLGIAFSIGLNPTGIRDIGLAVAAFALFLGGAGKWAIDTRNEVSL